MASNFGKRLQELRKAAGLTQKELAEKAGLSQNGISNWETGDRDPVWSIVQALAAALGVDCSEFQEKKPKPKVER